METWKYTIIRNFIYLCLCPFSKISYPPWLRASYATEVCHEYFSVVYTIKLSWNTHSWNALKDIFYYSVSSPLEIIMWNITNHIEMSYNFWNYLILPILIYIMQLVGLNIFEEPYLIQLYQLLFKIKIMARQNYLRNLRNY